MDMLPDFNAKRILLVEDDLAVVEQVNELLRAAGYAVENAYNFGDAIAADHNRYALVLVNNALCDRDGRTIVDFIRSNVSSARLPVVILNEIPTLSGNDPAQPRLYNSSVLLNRVQQMLEQPPLADMRPTTRVFRRADQAETETLSEEAETQSEPARREFDARLAQQLAALKTLSALGRSITSVLDLNQVLNQVVEAATTLTRAEEGLLLLPDEEDKALYLRAMKGIDDDSARNFRIRNDDSLVGSVYRSGKPVLVGDRGLLRVKTEYFVKSLVYVPMKYQGRIIGVLGVNNRRSERLFTQTDQELLLDLAAHAAIAIENARLYEERLLQNRQLTTLVEAGLAVNSTLALPDVLRTICRQVVEAFDVSACVIKQRHAETGEMYPMAWAWRAVWRPGQGPKISPDTRPMVKHAHTQNAFYTVSRDQTGNAWKAEVQELEQTGAQHLVALPLRAGNQPSLGTLELYYQSSLPEITAEFRARARGTALEMCAMLTQRPQTRPSPVLFNSAQQILDATGASWLVISLLTEDDHLVRVVKYGAAVFLDDLYPQQSLAAAAETQLMLNDQFPLNFHVQEADLPPAIREMISVYGAAAMLCLPLFVKGKPFGMFAIYGTWEARRFRPDEISLAWALITQAATAIENANLYRDLERSLEDLKKAQASLVQAARLSTMGELAAVVAHQINNPLTTVMVDSEILLQDLAEDSPLRDGVLAISRAGRRAHAVVKRLLSTARRENPDEDAQWVDVNQTIRNTLELVTTHIERGQITFEIDLDEAEPVYVEAVPGYLEDVWLNLLLNGRDALLHVSDALLGITSRREGELLQVTVWDNGPGIPSDQLDQIFEPFYTTKPHGQGNGLGLYICRQVIERCKGRITVESVVGQGTAFHVVLPVRS